MKEKKMKLQEENKKEIKMEILKTYRKKGTRIRNWCLETQGVTVKKINFEADIGHINKTPQKC